jgi:hypothetical protein
VLKRVARSWFAFVGDRSARHRPWHAVAGERPQQVIQPIRTQGSLKLGLCSPDVLAPKEKVELDEDVSRLLRGRQDAEANAGSFKLT